MITIDEKVINMRFGRLVVIKKVGYHQFPSKKRTSKWLCRCDCENYVEVTLASLRNGHTKSCGCLRKELLFKNNIKINIYKKINDSTIQGTCSNDLKYFFYFDIEDFYKINIHCWRKNDRGYIVTRNKETKKIIYMHRLIMSFPKSEIDHIDRMKNNNKKNNLRITVGYKNSANKNIDSRNTSGFIGVNYEKRNKKWQARITVNHNKYWLGYFDNINNAIIARLKAEKEYLGEFSPQRHLFNEYNIL